MIIRYGNSSRVKNSCHRCFFKKNVMGRKINPKGLSFKNFIRVSVTDELKFQTFVTCTQKMNAILWATYFWSPEQVLTVKIFCLGNSPASTTKHKISQNKGSEAQSAYKHRSHTNLTYTLPHVRHYPVDRLSKNKETGIWTRSKAQSEQS